MAGPKQAADMLRQLRYGTLQDELTEEIRAMVLAVTNAKKAGKITLTLSFKPVKSGQIEISDDIKVARPKEDKATSLFFPTVEGNLERQDPRQQQFEGIRSVDQEIEARRAPEATPLQARTVEDAPLQVRAAAGA